MAAKTSTVILFGSSYRELSKLSSCVTLVRVQFYLSQVICLCPPYFGGVPPRPCKEGVTIVFLYLSSSLRGLGLLLFLCCLNFILNLKGLVPR